MRNISVGRSIVTLHDHFWVPSAHALTRHLLRQCATCHKVAGRHYPLPSSLKLPKDPQGTSVRPFSNIRVDFMGHLTVKDRSGNHIKVYICLFTCLTTIAINLEIVEDLTKSSCLRAFRYHCNIF